jgi:integrase
MSDKEFSSKLAPFIESLLREKIACGYSYQTEKYILTRFDRFVSESGRDTGQITRELVADWSVQTPSEGTNNRGKRVSVVRLLAIHMVSLGYTAYIPQSLKREPAPDPYVFVKEELKDLFWQIDHNCFTYSKNRIRYQRFSAGYSVLFRMYYCCGLRNAEGINLRRTDVNMENNYLDIFHSKGDKDRRVYMSSSLSEMCQKYDNLLEEIYPNREWFFPGLDPQKHLNPSTTSIKMEQFWMKTGRYSKGAKKPTVHSLRHTFVVDRINQWIADGKNVDQMMAYLVLFLGHTNPDGSDYYYHTSLVAVKIVREIMHARTQKIIPSICKFAQNDQTPEIETPKQQQLRNRAIRERTKTTLGRILSEVKRNEW